MHSPPFPTLDDTLEGLSELSRGSEAGLVQFSIGDELAWLVNSPVLVHEVLGAQADVFEGPEHPFSRAQQLYTPSGLFALGLAHKGPGGQTHARALWRLAVEQSEALAHRWLAHASGREREQELSQGLREQSAAWSTRALYGVDMDAEIPELVAATLAYEDEALDAAAGPEGARARLAAFCEVLVQRRERAGDEGHAARTVLPTLLNASVATALTLAWTLYLLAHHPEALARVEAELDALPPDTRALAPPQLPRCRAALLESLRLYPPTWLLIRSVAHEHELGGQRLAPGELIALCPWTLHRNPRWWREADRFDPLRFEQHEPPVRGAWLPFGHGAHSCVGAHVALPMMQATLATLLRQLRPWPAAGPAPTLAARVSLRTQSGIRLVLEPRAGARRENGEQTRVGEA